MTVQQSDLTPGTIAVTLDGKLAIVVGYKPANTKYPVLYKFKVGRTTYKGNENEFRAVLGTVDLSAFENVNGSMTPPPPAPKTGIDNSLFMPAPLKGIKIGDMIEIRTRGGVKQAEYRGYNPRRPKNCVSLRMNGKEYKGPLSIVVGPVNGTKPAEPETPAKRTDKEIIDDIRNIYCALSPENLTCDGELPAHIVRGKRAGLLKELNRLFDEIGREVSESEAYSFV